MPPDMGVALIIWAFGWCNGEVRDVCVLRGRSELDHPPQVLPRICA